MNLFHFLLENYLLFQITNPYKYSFLDFNVNSESSVKKIIKRVSLIGDPHLFFCDDKLKPLILLNTKVKSYNEVYFKKLSKFSYFRIDSFLNNSAIINNIIEENHVNLISSDIIVIDLRFNKGGTDDSFQKLIPYAFSEDYEYEMDKLSFYLNNENIQNRIALFNLFNIKSKEVDDLILSYKKFKDQRGFFKLSENSFSFKISGRLKNQNTKVIILMSKYTASSAESFIEIVKKSSNCLLVGSCTKGAINISNLAIKKIHTDLNLLYPISIKEKIINRKKDFFKGIYPDIFVKNIENLNSISSILNLIS